MPTAPRLVTLAAALGALATLPAWAHHGWGAYDSTKLVVLDGQLESVSFQNPHVSARLAAGGKTWMLVLAPPSRMSSRGLPDGALAAGKTVRGEGYVHKTDPDEIRLERIIVDGKSVELR